MGEVIVVTSGKGGTGKTTTVGAVAGCLAVLGKRTLCVDCDAGLRNLDITIGMADYTVTDFTDVLDGSLPLMEACAEHPGIKGLFFLPAPAVCGPDSIDRDAMKKLVSDIKKQFDYCLVDSPAGLGAGFRLAAAGADMAIVVVTPDVSSIRNGQRVAEQLRSSEGISEIRLLVNRVRPRGLKRAGLTVDDIIDTTAAQLLGLVCEDGSVPLAANRETPLILFSAGGAAKQFLNVARRISGEQIPLDLA